MENNCNTKKCTKCNEIKNISEFGYDKKGKYFVKSVCKVCKRKIDKYYVTHNKTSVVNSLKKYHKSEKGKQTLKKSRVKWRENNRETYLKSSKKSNLKFRLNNKEKINFWFREKRKTDPIFKLSCNIRSSIYTSLKENKLIKNSKTHEILGCSFEQLKQHLESKFESWMNWDNYGKYNGELNHGWDIDHIIPISTAVTEEDVIRLNHYSNLQPLCSYVNRVIKRDYTTHVSP